MVSGSTYLTDQADQQENLRAIFAVVTQNLAPNQMGEITSPLIERLKFEGRDVKVSELFTRILSNSGIQNWDKIAPDLTNGNPEQYQNDQVMQQHAQVLQQAMVQVSQPMNQIPVQGGPSAVSNQAGQLQ